MNRIGIIAVIIEQNRQSVADVNQILSDYSDCIHARMGVPNHEKDIFIIYNHGDVLPSGFTDMIEKDEEVYIVDFSITNEQ
ncbi:MAG: hypothetical protein RR193_01805, partial [Christensenellaceae bacterium]